MATKLSNSHIKTIIENSKSYNILDTYIALAHMSREVNGKFLIQTYTDVKADLVNQTRKYVSISYKTVFNNISELIQLNILNYDIDICSWILVDMNNMVRSKSTIESCDVSIELTGFTRIRDFFFESEFHNMKANEKRLIVFLAQLCDSKASKSYTDFTMNLFKPNSRWMEVLKTKCKYYAKSTINAMLTKYESLFTDKSKNLREKDFAPKRISNFKFSFKCSVINKLDTNNDSSQYDLLKIYHQKEMALVKDRVRFAEITLSKTQQMHIVRSVCTIKEWFLKERIVNLIVNKYRAIQIHHSREPIYSLPAYLTAVVKAVINEFNDFKSHLKDVRGMDIGEQYIYSSHSSEDLSAVYNDIQSILNVI